MAREPRKIDKTKGYRIHLNVREHSGILPTFAQAHAGTPMEQSRWYPNDPDLADRESVSVKKLDDLLTLMQTGDHDRLANAVVLMDTHTPISWKDFFVREGRKGDMERFADLYNRVGKIKGGDPVPVAMLFQASETKTLRHYGQQWVKGQGINVDGMNVDFELFLSYLKDENWADKNIRKGQLYLVTGMAERSFASRNRETVRVYVNDRDAMRMVTRKELTTPPPAPEPYTPRPLTYDDLGPLD
jgi:hypothetical protein